MTLDSCIVFGSVFSGVFSLIEFLLKEERRTIPDFASSGSWNVDLVVLMASDIEASPSNVYCYYKYTMGSIDLALYVN